MIGEFLFHVAVTRVYPDGHDDTFGIKWTEKKSEADEAFHKAVKTENKLVEAGCIKEVYIIEEICFWSDSCCYILKSFRR